MSLSPDGRFLAITADTTGVEQEILYVRNLATGQTVEVSAQPGQNGQVSWIQGGDHPCLLYVNGQTAASTIYLACLTPSRAWAPVAPGEYPAWLGS